MFFYSSLLSFKTSWWQHSIVHSMLKILVNAILQYKIFNIVVNALQWSMINTGLYRKKCLNLKDKPQHFYYQKKFLFQNCCLPRTWPFCTKHKKFHRNQLIAKNLNATWKFSMKILLSNYALKMNKKVKSLGYSNINIQFPNK